jgi:pimeloyl-[acyl-carrier protein] methyl ester esterase
MDGTGNLFAGLIAALPSGTETTVIRYPTNQEQSYSQLLRFVESCLPASAPFVLVAESFSTPLAIQWAATHRPHLKGLVICAGFASSPVRGWLRSLGLLLSPICFLVPPPEIVIRFFLIGTDASSSLVMAVKNAIGSVKSSVLAYRLRQTLTCDAPSLLSDLRTPILLLQPTQDKLLSSVCLEKLLELRPEAAVEMIPGPHLLLQARAHESAEAIARFVQRVWTS